MTLRELRAFIGGLEITDAPTPDQWRAITAKLAEAPGQVQYHDGTGLPVWSDFYAADGPIMDLYS